MNYNCSSCGAEINDSMARCPYCGTLIAAGAEKEYMEKLHELRDDMEQLSGLPGQELRAQLKGRGRFVRRVTAAAAVAAALLALAIFLMEKQYERDNTADYIWGRENFPLLDELYEKGEYDRLDEMLVRALEEDRPLWNWEHYEEYIELMEDRG